MYIHVCHILYQLFFITCYYLTPIRLHHLKFTKNIYEPENARLKTL